MSENNKQYRAFNGTQLRVAPGEAGQKRTISGYAALFNSSSVEFYSWDGPYTELIMPGAFTDTLASDPDVRALIDHDPSKILGRTKAGTLRLKQDNVGLFCEIDLPDTQTARDLIVSMERGDITQMSFGFYITGQQWVKRKDQTFLEITSVDLFDVSVVTYPAYQQTSAEVRSAAEKLWKEKSDKEAEIPLDCFERRLNLIALQ